MLRVAYLTHTNISISETFVYDLVQGLNNEKDIDLTFISGHTNQRDDIKNLKTIFTGFANRHDRVRYGAYKVGQLIGGKGYTYKNRINKIIAERQLKIFKKVDYDVALVDFATAGVLVRRLLKREVIPFIVHVHGYDITSTTADPEYKKELKKLFKDAEYFVTPSEHMRRLLVLLGCEESKIRVIYRGILINQINPEPWSEKVSNDPGIVFLGRLSSKKHPIALLHAFRLVKNEIPKAYLTIIGDGELSREVKDRINTLSLSDSVNLTGALPREKAFQILRKHWIYAQHSVTSLSGDQEGFPFSLAEAAAHKLPVVSTIHNGIPENVIDGETGYLVPEHNYEMMAEKMIHLIKNPGLAEEMGKAGCERIKKLCKPEERIKAIKELLIKIS